jgi:ABC-type multidrug transport system ATPase subunit
MSAAGTVIDVHGLTKKFGDKVAVDNVDLQVSRGEIVGFLGPNGSGKTTTIRMICGLLRPDGGSGTCLGHDILTEAELIKREVGYMTQRFSFYEDLTIRENRRCNRRGLGPKEPPASARRYIVRRLEAAPGARRLHHAPTATPAAR